MRESRGRSCLLSDHLGSVVAVVNGNGTVVSQQRYLPFGGVRLSPGIGETDLAFTGERLLGGVGLMDCKAGWYSPSVAKFVLADTIVPEPDNPQGLNRYAYGYNNPVKHIDPIGHFSQQGIVKLLGVDTWGEVLGLFGERGILEGRWGWLAILRKVEVGDKVSIQLDAEEGSWHLGSSWLTERGTCI